jgi:hypothetical protein
MTRRHVLPSDTEDRGFMSRFRTTLARLHEKTGLRFAFSHSEDVTDDVQKHVSLEAERRGALNVLEDLETQTRWLVIEGESEAFEKQVDEALMLLLEIVPLRQLRGHARKKPTPVALKRMARGAGGVADVETTEILVASLASDNPVRVCGAAEAAAILGWPELAPALEAAAAVKRTSRVKRELRAAIAACTRAA